MEKRNLTWILIAWLSLGFTAIEAQNKNAKDTQYEKMVSLIEQGNYEFRVRSVIPAGGNTIHPTTIYSMWKIQGKFWADLPYFGRAYQPDYSADGGIYFDGEPEKLEITRNDKKRIITVQFRISYNTEHYDVVLAVGQTGYGNLTINSSKRQTISYDGTVSQIEESEKGPNR